MQVLCEPVESMKLNVSRRKVVAKISFFFPTLRVYPISNEGNAIICKYKIKETKVHRLSGNGAPRILCQSLININDGNKSSDINIFVTHLSLSYVERQKQFLEINDILKNIKGTKILVGDFNINDEDELNLIKMKRVSFLKTYPSWNPEKCFDNIFISKDIKKYKISTAKIKMSDHLGLEFEIEP